jgi:hypothetical protein
LFACNVWAQSTLTDVFSTGVDSSGNVLSAGQLDPHYTITSSPIGAVPALAVSPIPEWAANTPTSGWVNATGDANGIEPPGTYVYTLLFSLTGLDPSTAQIAGQWTSDNSAEIFLNGVDTGFSVATNGFGVLIPFSITSGFVSGQNKLQFFVTQDPLSGDAILNPEGLQVDISSATAMPVPEPAAISLLGLSGFLLLGRFLKNKN